MVQPFSDRVALGLSWGPLKLQDEEPRGRRSWWRLVAPPGQVLHEGIGPGDRVRVGPPQDPDRGLAGRVLGYEPDAIELEVDTDREGPKHPLAVTRWFDDRTLVRQRAALERGREEKSPLAEVLRGDRPPVPAPRSNHPTPRTEALSPAQVRALRAALQAREVALIWGPPGTGKTLVAAHLLRELARRNERPLALAESNAAADHLALTAARLGLEVVRLGPTARISGEAALLTPESRIRNGPLGKALAVLERDLRRARSAGASTAALWAERRQLLERAQQDLVTRAEVLATTLGSWARLADQLPPIHTAVIDEATQAIEPALWPLLGRVQRMVLVGDPKQLGPVVIDPGNPLQVSLFERLAKAGLALPMLEQQHRCAAPIADLLRASYGPAWQPAPEVAERTLEADPRWRGGPWPAARFFDTSGTGWGEAQDPVSRSWFNQGEVELVRQIVAELCAGGLTPGQIAVIAPYAAQVAALRRELPEVQVGTVNAWQGREQDVVICSFTRSNPNGEIGFVQDPRRLVVAVSRARLAWIGVGDASTLAQDPSFAELFDRLGPGLASVWQTPYGPA